MTCPDLNLATSPLSSTEFDFVKAQLARLPTRRDQALTPRLIVVATAFGTVALVILWFELFWRYCM